MHKRKRPFGLYVIVTLQFFIAISLAAGLIFLEIVALQQQILNRNAIFFTTFAWIIVGALVLANIGMLFWKRWGWQLTMILAGASLTLNIWLYFLGEPNYVDMAIYVVVAFYLNQRDVRVPFEHQRARGGAR